MRQDGEVSYLLGDHLGGMNLTLDATGNKVAELRYRAWDETRFNADDLPLHRAARGERDWAVLLWGAVV